MTGSTYLVSLVSLPPNSYMGWNIPDTLSSDTRKFETLIPVGDLQL
jgi:hypothetical protein